MRKCAILLISAGCLAAQILTPIRPDAINLISPAINPDGSVILFGARTTPQGASDTSTNLYLYTRGTGGPTTRKLTSYASESPFSGVNSITFASPIAGYTATPSNPGVEEVHVLNTSTGTDRTVATDREGCIQPLCFGCYHACVGPVHLTAEGTRVLYAVSRNNPFFVVNSDGTGSKQLPVYQGVIAPSPQRVISRSGTLVFRSSAPSGPTFAAQATDIYTIQLDGTGLRQVTRFGNVQFAANRPTLSGDGSIIVFETNYFDVARTETAQIWMVRSDGSGLRRLSSGTEAASSPSISADGTTVVFVQSGQLKRVRTTGDGAVLTLTRLGGSLPREPVISDDGTTVAFTLGPTYGTASAIYRIPTDTTTNSNDFTPVYAPRALNDGGVGTAAGYGKPSPGSLISVYGVNLALEDSAVARSFPLPITLNDLSLVVNGQPVPLVSVSPWQINAQLPQTVSPGSATLQVRFAGGAASPRITFEIKDSSPENFAYQFSLKGGIYSQAAAFHAGTGVPADIDHPAAAGETLELYGLGLGMTDPMVDAGMPSPSTPPARARDIPRLQIGGRDAAVTFAGLVPGLAGIYQVNLVVPSGLEPGIQYIGWRSADGAGAYSSIAVK